MIMRSVLERLKSEEKIITEPMIIESLNFISDTLLKNHSDTTSNLTKHYHWQTVQQSTP